MVMLCTSIPFPGLLMQPSFLSYPSTISCSLISLPLRRNNPFPIRVPTSSESQTKTETNSRANPKHPQFKIFSSLSQISSSAATTPATTEVEESPAAPKDSSGSDVIRKFYGGINAHDLGSVEDLIAENCIYEDLIFPQPFVGRKAILEFFNKFVNSISTELQFVIDDISNEDSSAVGVSWHLEWKGRSFPFSKGCSFYRLDIVNGKRQIIYGRDIVEPAIKPGETALVAISGVTWLLERFPRLVDLL